MDESSSRLKLTCLRALVVALCLWAATLPAAGGQSQQPPESVISDRAAGYLRNLETYLAGLTEFGFEATESFDEFTDSGLLVRYHNRRLVALRRPDKMIGEAVGDTTNRKIWKSGDTVAILDQEHQTYAILRPVPESIEGLLDFVAEQYGIVVPFADILHSGTYETFTAGARASSYLGLHSVNGFKCHHLAFEGGEIDWQLWIEAGAKPIPRKMLIRYKAIAGVPQYEFEILRWQESVAVPDSDFVFTPPPGAEELRPSDILGRPPSDPPNRENP